MRTPRKNSLHGLKAYQLDHLFILALESQSRHRAWPHGSQNLMGTALRSFGPMQNWRCVYGEVWNTTVMCRTGTCLCTYHAGLAGSERPNMLRQPIPVACHPETLNGAIRLSGPISVQRTCFMVQTRTSAPVQI